MEHSRWKVLLYLTAALLVLTVGACGGKGGGKDLSYDEAVQVVLDQVVETESLDHPVIVFGWPETLDSEDELRVYAQEDGTEPGELIEIETERYVVMAHER